MERRGRVAKGIAPGAERGRVAKGIAPGAERRRVAFGGDLNFVKRPRCAFGAPPGFLWPLGSPERVRSQGP